MNRVLGRHYQLLDRKLWLLTMEMNYQHPLSSPPMCSGPIVSSSDNSVTTLSTDSHQSRFLQTFIMKLALLVHLLSFDSSLFLVLNWIRNTFSVVVAWQCYMCLLSCVEGDAPGLNKCSCDSPNDFTHPLREADGDGRPAGVPRSRCAPNYAATWQHLQSAPRRCHC